MPQLCGILKVAGPNTTQMLPHDQEAILSRQRAAEDAIKLFKEKPGFAAVQVQVMRKSREWEEGLSAQEKIPASSQRLLAIIRLLDIRAQAFLAFVEGIDSQEPFAAMVRAFVDQAWQGYVGVAVPPMDGDSNYKSIDDRGWYWVSESYARVDAKEKEQKQTPASEATENRGDPTVFISYSWDDEPHKQWALSLANRLRGDGIDAIIDQTHLNLGGDTPEFMEKSIRDSRFVLVVCTEPYKERFDGRKGGAGYEGHIMTAQIVKKAGANKFIPLLRRGTWDSAMPTALEGLFGANLSKDSEDEYRKLVKHLHGVKSIRPLGARPKWLEEELAQSSSVEQTAEAVFLPSEDLTLLHGKSTFSLNIWLKNHTLSPMDGCRFTLTNLQKFSERHKEFQNNPFTAMELIKAQTIIADGTTDQAIPLANFQNTNKRTLLVIGTFPFESACILTMDILVEGGGKSRRETKFIGWKPGEDPEFVDDPRAEKPKAPPSSAFIASIQYDEQRKNLPESGVLKKIWKRPRWSICSRPEEFRKARFRDLDHCDQFIASASVRSKSRWTQYPWFITTPEHGDDFIASEVDNTDDRTLEHLERWVLFRSGQFLHNLALDHMPALSGRTHVLEILGITTAVFEFIGRMADSKIISDRTGISFEFHTVEGHQLSWPKDGFQMDDFIDRRRSWCQVESFIIDNPYSPSDLIERRRDLALDAALMIYSKFGWNDPPMEELQKAQREQFGPPIHFK